jgi:hypothetical protein
MYYQLDYYHFKYTSTRLNIFSENIIDSELAFYIGRSYLPGPLRQIRTYLPGPKKITMFKILTPGHQGPPWCGRYGARILFIGSFFHAVIDRLSCL